MGVAGRLIKLSIYTLRYIYSRVVTGTRDSQLLSFIPYEETSSFFHISQIFQGQQSPIPLCDGSPGTNLFGETWGSEGPTER